MINYLAQIGILIAIFLLLAASLNLVLGFGGVFSIMQAAFYAVGAYTSAILVLRLHAPFPLDVLSAFVLSAATGALVSLVLIRMQGELVIVATLALQLVFSAIFRNWNAVTGGSYGIFGIPRPAVFGVQLTGLPAFALYAAIVAGVFFTLSLFVAQSSFGLAVRGQREDPVLAGALGHDAIRERSLMFILGAGIAGVAGAVYAEFVGYIDPSSFDVSQSLSIITIVVVGGLGNLWGTLAAAIVLTFLPQLLLLVPAASNAAAQFQLLLFGLILVVIVRFWPRGIIPERPSVRAPRHTRTNGVAHAVHDSGVALERLDAIAVKTVVGTAPLVRLDNVCKSFGGLKAVDGVSFEIEPGRVTALIGPNGAGKTTLFNVICGLLRSDRGRIYVGSNETTDAPSYEIARLGVTRTFQDVRIFPRLTALENLVFALSSVRDVPRAALVDRAWQTLLDLGLDAYADRLAGDLSYAQQKMLMMGLVLVREDSVVFLDEIAAGLDHTSVHALARLIRRIAASGRTVCVVEHNLTFVWEVADIVFVLDAGRVIAYGPPNVIQADPHVTEIYFGQHRVPGRS